jgi:hypothetical protein
LRFSSRSPSDWRVVARAAQDQKGKPGSPVQRAKRAIPVRLARRVRLAHRVRKGTRALPGRLVRRQRRPGSLRVIRTSCETAACTAACDQDEVLVTAYCGPGRSAVTLINERSVSCPRRAATGPLVAVCAKVQAQ